MSATPQEAFAALYERLAPTPKDLMSGEVDAAVFEAFRDVRAAVHPDRIGAVRDDHHARGLMAHGLFLGWRDHAEAEFLLDAIRQHMMNQLRDRTTPHPDLFRLLDGLTRFCDIWRRMERAPEV